MSHRQWELESHRDVGLNQVEWLPLSRPHDSVQGAPNWHRINDLFTFPTPATPGAYGPSSRSHYVYAKVTRTSDRYLCPTATGYVLRCP